MGYGKILEKCARQDLLQLSLENMNKPAAVASSF